jgi:hypothetical protein
VTRTSGEQRLSNFLLWQSAYSELYFCEAYWPAFREIDFLRALRSYAARQRKFGPDGVEFIEAKVRAGGGLLLSLTSTGHG